MSVSVSEEEDGVEPHPLRHRPVKFGHWDVLAILVITLVSFWTRNFMLHFPAEAVFDEVHFGEFTNDYLQGKYFFDIHPPLAKLILFAFAKVAQYDGHVNFSAPGEFEGVEYVGLRQIPALFASFCAPVLFVACRCFGVSTGGSFAAAWMVVCDNPLIVEGRFILTDGILHFFVCLAIAATGAVRTQKYRSLEWWFALVFHGFAAGCAVSCKFTALSVLVFVGIVHLVDLISIYYKNLDFRTLKEPFLKELSERGCVIGLVVVVVLFSTFVIHLIVLPYLGPDVAFTPDAFAKSLIDPEDKNPNWKVRTENQSLVKNILTLAYYMHKYNMGITDVHPYSSKWYTWPLLTGKWVLFWNGESRTIACHGQPFNVYCATLSVFVSLGIGVTLLLKRKSLDFQRFGLWMCVFSFSFAYIASLIPFALVGRVLFFYHYLIPHIFGILNFIAMIDFYCSERAKRVLVALVCLCTSAAFLFWAPLTYGLPLDDMKGRILYPVWQG